MTDIEDVVRRSLAEQVRRQPSMADSAGRAIAGAAAVRRRNTVLTAGALVVALVAIVSGVVVLRGGGTKPALPPAKNAPSGTPTPTPSPSPSPSSGPAFPTIGVSAILGRAQLLLSDGRLLSLSRVDGGATAAYQTRDGWLVIGYGTGAADGQSLWLWRADGTAQRLLDRVDGSVVVASGGRRLAWRSANALKVGHLDRSDALVTDSTTPAPARGYPLAFAGSAVLLGYTETGGGLDNFDVWVPERGRYTPSWDQVRANGVSQVFGATADGRWLLGLVFAQIGGGGKDTCLARLDPLDTLRVVARACGLPDVREWATVSPDGHWLAYQSAVAGDAGTTLVDLTTVFQEPTVAGAWASGAPGIWTGPDTMVVQGADERFYRYRVGQSTAEQVSVLGMPPAGRVVLVPEVP